MIDPTVNPATLSRRTQFIVIAAVVAGALFIYGRAEDLYWLRMITKPLPVLLMALLLVLMPEKGRYQWATIAGLLLSATGDMLLEAADATFIAGLVAFLLAHVAYIVAFTSDARQLHPGRALLAFGYGAVMFAILVLFGDLGGMTIPVLFYVMVICAMLWRAAARLGAPGVSPHSASAGLWGAILFTFSDSLLALNRFAFAIPYAGYIVIITYWLGQADIALSAGREHQSTATN